MPLPNASISDTRRSAVPSARTGPVALAAAGALFALYPAIRPFSDESSLDGAAAYASLGWLLAHTSAMAAFTLLALGLGSLHLWLQSGAAAPRTRAALVLCTLGVVVTLPYYGAETFGLAAIGRKALDVGDPGVLDLADAVRYGPGLGFLVVGLVLLGVGTALLAVAIWRSTRLSRWSGVPLAIGIALYLPQFATPEPVRIAHGALVAIGCATLAWTMSRSMSRVGDDDTPTIDG